MSAARRLCEEVGQAWRAASLGGGGAQGPVPLAAAADEADEADSAWEQPEDLAAEVGIRVWVGGWVGGRVVGVAA